MDTYLEIDVKLQLGLQPQQGVLTVFALNLQMEDKAQKINVTSGSKNATA